MVDQHCFLLFFLVVEVVEVVLQYDVPTAADTQ
jgi:hypothetical protein